VRRKLATPPVSSRLRRPAVSLTLALGLVAMGLFATGSMATASTTPEAPGGTPSASDPGTLNVHRSGTGAGTVTSDPAGIDCGPTCSAQFLVGTAVTLTAVANDTSAFDHWGGACNGTNPTCSIDVAHQTSVTAVFALIPTPPPTPTPNPTSAPTPRPTATPIPPTPTPRGTSPAGSPTPPDGDPGSTQPGTGSPGSSESPAVSASPGDSGTPSQGPGGSPPGGGPGASTSPLVAGFGSGEAALVVGVASVLTAIVIAVGVGVVAIADRRAREKRRNTPPTF
jgi:Divergent InlB B-repeat domain